MEIWTLIEYAAWAGAAVRETASASAAARILGSGRVKRFFIVLTLLMRAPPGGRSRR